MDVNTTWADPALEKDGVWVGYREGSRVLVARFGNPNFQRAVAKNTRLNKTKKIDPVEEKDQLCQIISRTILLGWEGFTAKGKKLDYTPDLAYSLLATNLDFRNEITELSMESENFKAEQVEETSKN